MPGELDIPAGLVQDFESVGRLWLLLDDEVDGGVVRAERVGRHAGEESRVLALGSLDTDRREHTVLLKKEKRH